MIDKTLLNLTRIDNRPANGNLTSSKRSKVDADENASASTGTSDVVNSMIHDASKLLASTGPDSTSNVEEISSMLTGRGYDIDHLQLADNIINEYIKSK